MRRKSTRSAQKATPDKGLKDDPVKTRRSRRRRHSSVKSSDSDDEPLRKPVHTPDTTTKSHTPSDDEVGPEEQVWKVTTSDDASQEGHKLKICLTRPNSESPDKARSKKSGGSQTEDDDKVVTRRTRSQGSPVVRNEALSSQEEEGEERKGKGKSKSKHKTKIEKSPHLSEGGLQTNNEISENVQVTAQSPSIDKPVHNETKVSGDDIIANENTLQEEPIVVLESEQKAAEIEIVVSAVESPEVQTDPKTNTIEATDNESCQNTPAENEPISEPEPVNNTQPELESSEQLENREQSPKLVPNDADNEVAVAENKPLAANADEKNIESAENVTTEQNEPASQETAQIDEPKEAAEPSVIEQKDVTVKDAAPMEIPTPKKECSIHIKLRRCVDYQVEADASPVELLPPANRVQWGSCLPTVSTLVKINLETIRVVWPAMDFPEEPDLQIEEDTDRRRSKADSPKRIERKASIDTERPAYEQQSSVGSQDEDNSNIIAFNRKISIVDDTASKLKPPPSPAKNPVSDVLYITNLVRPFTLKQLKELLERTGKIEEEDFWTDRIKSKCYVRYASKEEAELTRNALHGVQWPIGNGKKLVIEYAAVEDLLNAKNPPPPAPVVEEEKLAIKENLVEPSEVKKEEKSASKPDKKRHDAPVREWDLGKKDTRRERSRSRDRSRKHKRATTPAEDFIARKNRKMEESMPLKLMDDLFLKTKASPSIYWQPLSPDEITTKQHQRLIRMEEHKRRMEENFRMKNREVGRGVFRRRYE